MRSIFGICIAVLAIFIVTTSVAAQDETTKEIVVPGETGLKWVNTGITVATGDTVKLEAKGQVDVGGSYGAYGPEGTTKFSEQPVGYYPLETKMRYGLAAKINPTSSKKPQPAQSWVYGEKKEVVVARGGTLWLTVNDDAPEGNVGEFTVQVTIVKKKK
ncbi:MAG: hypothetical protein PSX80_16850 [bacterium]|nr:hypothetical protein [bacterium]